MTILLTACSNIEPAQTRSNTTFTVEISKFKFIPAELTIHAGDSIKWINKEKRQYHSVWFESSGEPEPDYFFPDESYKKTFDQPGVYSYRCGPHPKMTGKITVL